MRSGWVLSVEASDFVSCSALVLPREAQYAYLVEQQSKQLTGVLPKSYTMFSDELLRIFNNSVLDQVGGDIIGRIYEYFLNKFAKNITRDDGVFFTPKSLVKMIVNVLEPTKGILLDPACGSGGMFVQTGDFVERVGLLVNNTMTFLARRRWSITPSCA